MCASGLYQLRIQRIVFGASNERFGGLGSVLSNDDYKHPHTIEIVAGVDAERSVDMLKRFYLQENMLAPPEKRKVRSCNLTPITADASDQQAEDASGTK